MATGRGSTRGGPSEEELLELSHQITSFWFNLGIRLGLSSDTLDTISNDVQFGSPQRKGLQMLREWSQRRERFSYQALSQALIKEGKAELAQKYCAYQGSDQNHAPQQQVQALRTSVPSNRDLRELASKIPQEWKELGIFLDLQLYILDSIAVDMRFPSPTDKAFEMLTTWRRVASSPTYKVLMDALEEVGRLDLVRELQAAQQDSDQNHAPQQQVQGYHSMFQAPTPLQVGSAHSTGQHGPSHVSSVSAGPNLMFQAQPQFQMGSAYTGQRGSSQDPSALAGPSTDSSAAPPLRKRSHPGQHGYGHVSFDQTDDENATSSQPQGESEGAPKFSAAAMSQVPISQLPGKKHVLLLAETWDGSDDNGLSIISKEVAVAFARTERVQVSCLASEVSDELQRNAKDEKVHLCCAREYKGLSRRECLGYPPECLSGVNVIITYGRHLGKFGPPLKDKFTNSKWVHIACSKSEEEAEGQQVGELQYCRGADLALAIGVDAAEEYGCRLQYDGKAVRALTPGIYPGFGVRPFSEKPTTTFRVAVFYPPAVEMQASPERFSVALKAVSSVLSRSAYRLISVCAPGDNVETVRGFLDNVQKLPSSQNEMRKYCRGVKERMQLFARVDLLILPFLPSTSDHFGFVALQAISSVLPVLVTWESGIGQALRNITYGDARIVDCDDPKTWQSYIEKEKEKNNRKRYDEATALRASWEETYSWGKQCDEVLEGILKTSDEADRDPVKEPREHEQPIRRKRTFDVMNNTV